MNINRRNSPKLNLTFYITVSENDGNNNSTHSCQYLILICFCFCFCLLYCMISFLCRSHLCITGIELYDLISSCSLVRERITLGCRDLLSLHCLYYRIDFIIVIFFCCFFLFLFSNANWNMKKWYCYVLIVYISVQVSQKIYDVGECRCLVSYSNFISINVRYFIQVSQKI